MFQTNWFPLQGNPLMLPPMPIHQGNPNGHISGMGGRSRGHARGRGGGSQRRNNYHTPRHMQQQQQLQPQQQQMPPESASPAPNAMQLQQDQMGQQLAPPPPPEAQLQPMPYYAPNPYAAYSGYQTTYFAPHHGPIQASPNAAAAAAQGAPVYISHMPLYNYMGGYFYHMLPPSEYQYMTEDGGQGPGVVDDRQAQEMPQIWHPAPMYAEEYQEVAHVNGDELNHNSSSLASSETSSMLSPNYPIYDAQQMHEMQQQMGVMQIYDDGQLAPLQAMHPVAGPVPQVSSDILLDCLTNFSSLLSFYSRSMRMNCRIVALHPLVLYPSLGHCLQMLNNHLSLFRHHLHIISFSRNPRQQFALNSRRHNSSS